jgi:hypothetical protein
MSSKYSAITLLLCAASIGWPQQAETRVGGGTFVPAGTLVRCTLDEPNFSSRTAQVGDPILCRTTSVEMFGHSVIPRGAYLSARLEAYRDPGHFVGKGWLQLEFDSLKVAGGSIPLSAKLVSVTRYRVDGSGRIQGKGHPTRDAVEWAIPILWPVKVLTLPARGPRPALKGETTLEVRIMDDMVIPEGAYSTPFGLNSRSSVEWPGIGDREANLSSSRPAAPSEVSRPSAPQVSAKPAEQYRPAPVMRQAQLSTPTQVSTSRPLLTLIVLRGGQGFLVTGYWVNRGILDYTTNGGFVRALPLEALDLPLTQRLNAERGVAFVLSVRNGPY